jgi:hypothetical protein
VKMQAFRMLWPQGFVREQRFPKRNIL